MFDFLFFSQYFLFLILILIIPIFNFFKNFKISKFFWEFQKKNFFWFFLIFLPIFCIIIVYYAFFCVCVWSWFYAQEKSRSCVILRDVPTGRLKDRISSATKRWNMVGGNFFLWTKLDQRPFYCSISFWFSSLSGLSRSSTGAGGDLGEGIGRMHSIRQRLHRGCRRCRCVVWGCPPRTQQGP